MAELLLRLNREERLAMVIATHNGKLAEKMTRRMELLGGQLEEKEHAEAKVGVAARLDRTSGVTLLVWGWLLVLGAAYGTAAGRASPLRSCPSVSMRSSRSIICRTGCRKCSFRAWRNAVCRSCDAQIVNAHPDVRRADLQDDDRLRIAGELGATWLVSGSLTQVGNKASIDLQGTQERGRPPPFFVFMTAEDLDMISDAMDRVAESVANEITGVVQVDSVRVMGNQRVERGRDSGCGENRQG